MKSSKSQINMFDEIVMDYFAGGGGASTGIELALGRPVNIAINHDMNAIALHKINHPYTEHYCESVWEVSPREACRGRRVAGVHLSPDCTHFSKAKGKKPVKQEIRGLAWVALKVAAEVRPRVITLENVEEFTTWGPLRSIRDAKTGRCLVITTDEKGKQHTRIAEPGEVIPNELILKEPDPNRKGETFNKFKKQLIDLGYTVDYKVMKACDYGAPTIRKRFFLIARCDGKDIVWPEPTHGDPESEEVKNGTLLPYRTAAECIDWSLPCPSIFDTSEEIKEKFGLRAKRPLSENTMKRIARGIQKFVVDNPEPFIVQINHSGADWHYTKDINKPFSTLTSKNGNALITPVMSAIGQTGYSNDRSYSINEPVRTLVSKQEQIIIAPTLIQYHSEQSENVRGQSIEKPILTIDGSPRYAMVSAFISKYYSGGYDGAGSKADDPIGTITSIDHNAIVAAFISRQFGTSTGHKVDKPSATITSVNKSNLVKAFLIKYYGQGTGQKVDEPIGTLVSRDRFGIVTVHGIDYQIVDIGMRMLEPHELYKAQGFPEDYIIDFDINGKSYSKAEKVKRVGNSVPPQFLEAIFRSNLPELCSSQKITSMEELNRKIAI